MGNKQGGEKSDRTPRFRHDTRTAKLSSNAEIGAQLKKVPILSQYSDEELAKLGAVLETRAYQDGEHIIEQGQIGDGFFIIAKGVADVTRIEADAKEALVLGELKSGDYFGELALLENQARGATVTAKGSVSCYYLDRKQFQELFNQGGTGFNVKFAKRTAISAEQLRERVDTSSSSRPKDAVVAKTSEVTGMIHAAIKDNVLFLDFNDDQLKEIIGEMYKEEVKAGSAIITQGERGDKFYVIESGEFYVTKDEKKVAERKAGQAFGELALMYNALRAASVTAENDAVVWVTERNTFRHLTAAINTRDTEQYTLFLGTVDLLKPLANYERQMLAEALEEINFPNDHVIFKQDDPGDVMYLVRTGTVKVVVDGKEVNRLNRGDYFGERALLKHQNRAASVTTVGECNCLHLNEAAFSILLGPLDSILEKKQEEYLIDDEKKGDGRSAPGKMESGIKFEDLKVLGTLGQGSFGYVQLVQDQASKRTFALKAVNKAVIVETGQQSHIMSEKNVMAMLNHPFIIRLHQTFKDRDRLYFLLEPVLGGELFTLLRALTLFDTTTARFYAGSVTLAFEYMHSLDVIFRDLKPENILLDAQGYLKITDFGFAKVMTTTRTLTLCGTPDYLAPEIVAGKGHGKGVDWWTLGILIYEMLASTPPFYDEDPMKLYAKIMTGDMSFPPHFSKSAVSLIKKLLNHRPTRRLGVVKGGAQKIKDHPWFEGLDWEKLYQRTEKVPIVPQIKNECDLSNFDDVQDLEPDPVPIYVEDKRYPDWDAAF